MYGATIDDGLENEYSMGFDTLVTAERRPKRQMVTQNDSESCK